MFHQQFLLVVCGEQWAFFLKVSNWNCFSISYYELLPSSGHWYVHAAWASRWRLQTTSQIVSTCHTSHNQALPIFTCMLKNMRKPMYEATFQLMWAHVRVAVPTQLCNLNQVSFPSQGILGGWSLIPHQSFWPCHIKEKSVLKTYWANIQSILERIL